MGALRIIDYKIQWCIGRVRSGSIEDHKIIWECEVKEHLLLFLKCALLLCYQIPNSKVSDQHEKPNDRIAMELLAILIFCQFSEIL